MQQEKVDISKLRCEENCGHFNDEVLVTIMGMMEDVMLMGQEWAVTLHINFWRERDEEHFWRERLKKKNYPP